MHDLKNFFVANQCFVIIVVAAREENANCLGRTFFCFAKCLDATHARQFLRRNYYVDRSFSKRVQSFGTAGGTMHRIAISEPGTEVVQGALFAVQQKYLRFDLVKRQNRPSGCYV